MNDRLADEVLSSVYSEEEGALRVVNNAYTKLESDTLFVAKIEGWTLSENNYSDSDKAKVDTVEQTAYNMLGSVTIANDNTEHSMFTVGIGTNQINKDKLTVGRIIRIEFSNNLSSGIGDSSYVRLKLNSTTLVENLSVLPNSLNSNIFLGSIDIIIVNDGVNGIVRVVGKSDVVTNQQSVLVRDLGNSSDIMVDLSNDIVIDLSYQFVNAKATNILISRKGLILLK